MTDRYDGPGEFVWRQHPGGKLHAVRFLDRLKGLAPLMATCCDRGFVTSGTGEELDYRYTEYGNTCRKKGCAAYFEASRGGRLG